jgi:hypothetical protein
MKRLVLAAIIAAGVVVGVARTSGASASGQSASAQGWWWARGPVPAPPTVPSDGLMVGADPGGTNAIAALRYQLAPDQGSPVLTLTVATNGDVNGASAAIGAYRAGGAWTPAQAGAWDARPPVLATPEVKGKRSADGTTWTFDLTALKASGSTLDIVLQPIEGNFEISFVKPSPTALATTSSPSAGSSTPSPASSSVDSEPASVNDFFDLTLDPSVNYTPAAESLPPTAPPTEIALATNSPSQRGSAALALPGATKQARKGVGLGLLLLAAAGLAAYGLRQVATPPLRALGPMTGTEPVDPAVRAADEPTQGGLGRFARPRRGTPPKL